jgi:hypothetical protein
MSQGLLTPARQAPSGPLDPAGRWVSRHRILNTVGELGVAPEEVPLQQRLHCLVMKGMASGRPHHTRQLPGAGLRGAALKVDQDHNDALGRVRATRLLAGREQPGQAPFAELP